MSKFKWIIGSPPPPLQSHSAAKLRLIENYLAQYFETVVPNPRSERLQISLVDGFCGGGAFLSGSSKVPGSPIVMLNAIEEAEKKLNAGRLKKLQIDAHFYFVDKSNSAIDYLTNELSEHGFADQIGQTVHLMRGRFEDHYDSIIKNIQSRARAGRSIFLLDQCGYNKVPMSICRDIFQSLTRSEIILTFAIDWLIAYLSQNAAFLKALAPIEISEQQVKRFIENKGVKGGRFLTQRLIIRELQLSTRAPYFTPFFIRSDEAGRDLWLIHLSKHPTARNVMTSSHWTIQNASIHQGPAGLNMLGFDPNWEDALPLDFQFDGNADREISSALATQIPYKIEESDGFGPITFDAFQSNIANDTAATLSQMETALLNLHSEKDIEILTPTGQLKRPDARLKSTDRLQLTRAPMFPGFKLPK